MICYLAGDFKAGNSKPRCNGGRRSTFVGNSVLLPSDVIDFAMLPAQRFWRETVCLLDVMWPLSNGHRDRALLEKNIQLYNNTYYFSIKLAYLVLPPIQCLPIKTFSIFSASSWWKKAQVHRSQSMSSIDPSLRIPAKRFFLHVSFIPCFSFPFRCLYVSALW